MKRKKKISKKTIHTRLLLTCIFLILTCTLIVGKSLNKENANAAPVSVLVNAAFHNSTAGNTKHNTPYDGQIKKSVENTPTVNKSGEKYIYDAAKISAITSYKQINNGKKVAFLTFDDGPSTTVTPKILDILKKYNVKATFFLLGESIDTNEKSKELVKREFNEGHALGNHTYSHNRGNMLFPNEKVDVPVFMEDIKKNDMTLKNILGKDFNTRILRLPGGYMSRIYYHDPNLPKLDIALKEKKLISVDWNVEIEDSVGNPNKTSAELFSILKAQVGTKSKVIILMHDSSGKIQTANALPKVIEYLKAQGYEFGIIK